MDCGDAVTAFTSFPRHLSHSPSQSGDSVAALQGRLTATSPPPPPPSLDCGDAVTAFPRRGAPPSTDPPPLHLRPGVSLGRLHRPSPLWRVGCPGAHGAQSSRFRIEAPNPVARFVKGIVDSLTLPTRNLPLTQNLLPRSILPMKSRFRTRVNPAPPVGLPYTSAPRPRRLPGQIPPNKSTQAIPFEHVTNTSAHLGQGGCAIGTKGASKNVNYRLVRSSNRRGQVTCGDPSGNVRAFVFSSESHSQFVPREPAGASPCSHPNTKRSQI